MYIVILVKNNASKKIIKDICTFHGHGFEFVHSTQDLIEAFSSGAEFFILEARFGDQDYEDILDELNLQTKQNHMTTIMINNTSDSLNDESLVDYIVEEYTLMQQLSQLLTPKRITAKRILYASDDRFMHRVIGDILTQNGFVVLDAFDGIEALSTYKSEEPDLVLTDLDMPGMNGLELCQAIKIKLSDNHTPVIILSGSNYEEDIVAAHAYHAKAYLTKPVPPDKLIRKINELTH